MRMNFRFFNERALIVSSMLALLILLGCSDDDDDSDPVAVAYVSIFHASPDAPDLDVVLDKQAIFNEPLEYSDYTGYRQFYTGNRKLEFNAYNANNVLADTTYNFQAGKAYSVFVINEVDELSTLIVEDSTEQPATGKVWIRFIHLSPDGPAVDFTLGEDDEFTATNRQYKQTSDFTELNAANYPMVMTATASNETLVTVPDTEFKSGGVYTIIARGFADPPAGNTHGLSIQIIRNQ